MSNVFKIITSINEAVELVPFDNIVTNQPHFIEEFGNIGDYGNMRFKKISLSELTIWISEYKMDYKTVFHAEVGQPILEAHITLSNRMVQSIGRSQNSIYDNGEFNITYAPYMENKVLFPGGGAYTTFDIHPSELLLKKLSQDFPFLKQFLNKTTQQKENTLQLLSHRSFLNLEMENLVNKILVYISQPYINKPLLSYWALDLFILFLLRSQNGNFPQYRHHAGHIDALIEAKKIVESQAKSFDDEDNFSSEMAIADQVGLSLFQLRTGFQRAFGMNLYQLNIQIRLLKAMELLKSGQHTVLGVAMMTGFKSREGFSRAFKRFYGTTPGAVSSSRRH